MTDFKLRDRYIEPPFSALDSKNSIWLDRKRFWKNLGIKSEVGRSAKAFHMKDWADSKRDEGKISGNSIPSDTSIFDPYLCEIMYHWFCYNDGKIIDPFAGGSVRGIVAKYLNYNYTGIELRKEQVESNYDQSNSILEDNPTWICGDSNEELDKLNENFDMLFSCPPYWNLEIYSDDIKDLSNMNYNDFLKAYRSIIKKSCDKLLPGSFGVFVVGDIRDKKTGEYVGFVNDTYNAFKDSGMIFWNEAILLNSIVSASLRADKQFSNSQKLVKVHQNILIFKKPGENIKIKQKWKALSKESIMEEKDKERKFLNSLF